MLGVHLIYLLALMVILCAEAGIWTLYNLVVIAYCIVRMSIGAIRGYPTLTHRQEIVLLFLPLWGPLAVLGMAIALQMVYQAAGVMPLLQGQ